LDDKDRDIWRFTKLPDAAPRDYLTRHGVKFEEVGFNDTHADFHHLNPYSNLVYFDLLLHAMNQAVTGQSYYVHKDTKERDKKLEARRQEAERGLEEPLLSADDIQDMKMDDAKMLYQIWKGRKPAKTYFFSLKHEHADEFSEEPTDFPNNCGGCRCYIRSSLFTDHVEPYFIRRELLSVRNPPSE
jgi:hypothetical protein